MHSMGSVHDSFLLGKETQDLTINERARLPDHKPSWFQLSLQSPTQPYLYEMLGGEDNFLASQPL